MLAVCVIQVVVWKVGMEKGEKRKWEIYILHLSTRGRSCSFLQAAGLKFGELWQLLCMWQPELLSGILETESVINSEERG